MKHLSSIYASVYLGLTMSGLLFKGAASLTASGVLLAAEGCEGVLLSAEECEGVLLSAEECEGVLLSAEELAACR